MNSQASSIDHLSGQCPKLRMFSKQICVILVVSIEVFHVQDALLISDTGGKPLFGVFCTIDCRPLQYRDSSIKTTNSS